MLPLCAPSVSARARTAAPAVGREATVLLIDGRPLMRECLARAHAGRVAGAPARRRGLGHARRAAAARSRRSLPRLRGRRRLASARLAASFPGAALVVLSDDQSHASIARAAAQGCAAISRPRSSCACWCRACAWCWSAARRCRSRCAGATAQRAAPHRPPRPLSRFSAELFTPKELEVLRSLASGRQNKLIAHELAICETTVKVHLRHIFRKLGTTNRTHAALLARDLLDGRRRAVSRRREAGAGVAPAPSARQLVLVLAAADAQPTQDHLVGVEAVETVRSGAPDPVTAAWR